MVRVGVCVVGDESADSLGILEVMVVISFELVGEHFGEEHEGNRLIISMPSHLWSMIGDGESPNICCFPSLVIAVDLIWYIQALGWANSKV